MPDRTGLETIATLRARGEMVPVILMSGTFQDADVGRSASPEGVYRLAKPFGLVDMRAALLEMMSAVKISRALTKG